MPALTIDGMSHCGATPEADPGHWQRPSSLLNFIICTGPEKINMKELFHCLNVVVFFIGGGESKAAEKAPLGPLLNTMPFRDQKNSDGVYHTDTSAVL